MTVHAVQAGELLDWSKKNTRRGRSTTGSKQYRQRHTHCRARFRPLICAMRAAKEASLALMAQMAVEKGSSQPNIFIARQPCNNRHVQNDMRQNTNWTVVAPGFGGVGSYK